MIILSLTERNAAAMRLAILSAPEKADAVEVRLDVLPRSDLDHLGALFEGSPRPLIATCRRRTDGGFYTGGEARRVEILWAAIRAGAAYVDVEHGSAAAELAGSLAGNPSVGVILSYHDRKKMPANILALRRRMARTKGVKAIKIVGAARGPDDLLVVHAALLKAGHAAPPLVCFAMGSAGTLTRVMAPEWGSWATYACSAAGKAAAPGQVCLPDLIGMYRIEDIDDETRLAGIIGTPLHHTLSPAIHNAAYHADGINFRYLPIEIPAAEGLKHLKKMMRGLRLRGLSVTAPYKIRVMKYLDRVEPLARRIGAANTIINDGRRLVGFNTDVSGGFSALVEALAAQHSSPRGLTMAIVGSGGSARALAHAASWAGAHVIVASRRVAPGKSLARATGGRHVMISKLSRERYDVLINCTPANATLPDAAIKGRLVYDVIYRPQATGLLKRAQERGIPTLGGLEMLVRQAADQYVMFTGRDAPLDAMRDAARMELERAEENG